MASGIVDALSSRTGRDFRPEEDTMAKRILVPIDQGISAEMIVSAVGGMARESGATVRLLHVAPVPEHIVSDHRVVAYVDQEASRLEAEGLDHLRTFEGQLHGVPVESVVRFGNAADEILAEATAFGADLIAVSTRSRSSLTRTLLGSVAETVFRRATVPVMLLRPGVS
jgi:universal stress protein A